MQTKQKSNLWKLLAGAASAAAVLLVLAGCPTSVDNNGGATGDGNPAPEKPVITGSQTGFELIDSVNLKTVTDADATNPSNVSAVISLTWEGEGAKEYNLYYSTDAARPTTPAVTGIKGNAGFVRGLEAETEYYIWVEAKNPNGTTASDFVTKTTGKKGLQSAGGVERGDYPRNIKVSPGNGSLTVSWNLADRAGWYEVYYTPKDAVPHIDVTATRRFKWDEAPYGSNTAYQDTANTGYTRQIYPFLPDSASGWTGYYVGPTGGTHSDTRPILGVNQFGTTPPTGVEPYPAAGSFYKIKEIWQETESGPLQPYKALDSAFASAIPWDGANNRAGTAGTPIKFYGTSVTITGLTNDTAYDVWIRCPNANGERGYGYISGTPGVSTIPAPANVQVTTPADTTRNLLVTWDKVEGVNSYRIYASKFQYTPGAAASYTSVTLGDSDPAAYTLSALASGTTYYVWVVAEQGGAAGNFGSSASGKTGTAPASGNSGDKFIAGTQQKVKTVVYVEVNDRNPLNAGSYILEDGTYLFDYMTIFAANIRSRNCALETEPHGCTKQGPHVHLNENVRYILENRNKYLVPLQNKGIKVLLGLLGDHDGIGFGTMSDADIETFATDVKATVDLYHLDGVDFDDEWASKEDWDGWTNSYGTISPNSIWTYPVSNWGWPTSTTVYRNPTMGIVAGNGQFTAPTTAEQNTMWLATGDTYLKTILAVRQKLGTDKTVTLYEYNTGRYITPNGADNGTATKAALEGAIDFALQPWYNRYIEDSINGLPRGIYSPFGMDLSGEAYSSQNGAPNPPIVSGGSETGSNTIHDYATRFKTASDNGTPYNVLYFYGLQEGSRLLKRQSSDSTARITREEYISRMSRIVFGQDVLVTADGGDYRKDW